jgi:hypothetical protein
MSPTTDQPPGINYHWAMTVQTASGFMPLRGVIELRPGATREEVFTWALTQFRERLGHDKFATMFFSLERNDLGIAETGGPR